MKHNRRHFKCVSKQHKSENVRSFFNKFFFSALKLAPANVQKMLSNIHSVPVAMKPSNEEYATIPATKRQENKVLCRKSCKDNGRRSKAPELK